MNNPCNSEFTCQYVQRHFCLSWLLTLLLWALPSGAQTNLPPGTLAVASISGTGAGCSDIVDSLRFTFGYCPGGGSVTRGIFGTLLLTTNDIGKIFPITQAYDGNFAFVVSILTNGTTDWVGDEIQAGPCGFGEATLERNYFSPLPPGGNGIDFAGFYIDNLALEIDQLTFTHDEGRLWTELSWSFLLFVNSVPWARPTILTPPQNQMADVGSTVQFVVSASGNPPLGYQWFFNRTNSLTGGSNSVLELVNVQPGQAGAYTVVVTNRFGAVTSSPAILTLFSRPPTILAPPQSQTARMGSTVHFVVSADGDPPPAYQWFFNGIAPLNGGTNSVLELVNVQPTQAGAYTVVVTNAVGAVTSPPAILTVLGPAGSGDLFVASFVTGDITRIDGTTGTIVYSVQQAPSTINLAKGPDGELYVTTLFDSTVVKTDLETGAPLGVFASDAGLATTVGITFGPDGNLYVASRDTGAVLRFNSITGAFLDTFVPSGSGGLNQTEELLFGPDGNLYVTEFNGDRVLRYSGATGTFLGVFASSDSLSLTRGMAFGPDGNLYVSGNTSDNVVRFDGTTGAFLGVFATGILGANGIAFGPDGNLYVASEFGDAIVRVNGTNGTFIDNFANVTGPIGILFDVNLPPVTGTPFIKVIGDEVSEIRARRFLIWCSDPDNDPLSLTAVTSPSAMGAVVTLETNRVSYAPPMGFLGDDTFGFTITDGHGGFASGTASILVEPRRSAAARMLPPITSPGALQVNFTGFADLGYTVERAESLDGPWTALGNVLTDDDGAASFTNWNPPAGSAFYRAVH